MKLNKKHLYWISALALGFLAYYVFQKQGIHIADLAQALGRFGVFSVSLAFVFISFQILNQILRLWVLLPPGKEIAWLSLARAFVYGQAVNSFAPARAGDAVKAVAMSNKEGGDQDLSLANAAGVLIADKLVDILSLFLLVLFIGSSQMGNLRDIHPPSPLVVLGSLVGLGLILYILSKLLPGVSKKIVQAGRQFFVGLSSIRNPVRFSLALAFSMGSWAGEAWALMALASAQGYPLAFSQTLLVLVILNLGIAIPVSVANIGAFEAAMAFGLAQFNIPTVEGLAISTVHHALQVGATVVWSAVLWVEKRLFANRPQSRGQFRVSADDKAKALNYYQKVSGDYHGTVEKGLLIKARERERLAVLTLADLKSPGNWMADIGCGHGFYALEAKKCGMRVCAVDAAEGMVQSLSTKVDEVAVADVEALHLARKFDRVVCAGVMDFVLNPETVFANLAELVAPGGRLVVLAPRLGPGGLFYRIEKWFFGFKVNLYSVTWFEKMAKRHGLEPKAFQFPLPTNMAALFERPLPVK